ncbi:MAG TPA: C40 family peptidase [Gemmatimonadaceae bacterium]|nr:C40 family peptidase [Gemmatimonadaceae bacterium]
MRRTMLAALTLASLHAARLGAQDADIPDTLALPPLVPAAAVGAAASPSAPAAGTAAVAPDSAAGPRDAVRAFNASARSLRDSLVVLARAQVGRRYVFGGETPERGFDCSGLVQYLLAAFDAKVPRTAAQQARAGARLGRDTTRLRPGDLLTFGRGKRASHVGIYVGGGRFIHASSKAGRVIESPLNRPPAKGIKPWRDARRVLVLEDSVRADTIHADAATH